MIYSIEDKPPVATSFFAGLQHVLTTFGINITVPLIIGPQVGLDPQQMSILIGAVLFTAGVTTFLQVNFGSRLPVYQGSSFSFIGPYLGIIAVVSNAGPDVTMQYIAGAIMLGSFFEIIVGFSGLFGKLQKFVSPVVIGPVIVLIGLSLFSVGAPQAGQNWLLATIVIVCAFLFSLVLGPKNRFVSMFSILMAIAVGYVVALFLGEVQFDYIANAQWFRTEVLFPWGLPKFDLGFTLVILAGYLASMIESYGDYHAVNTTAEGPPLKNRQINRGLGFEGVGCFLTSLWGGFSNTSFTGNIGVVGLTRVASRRVLTFGAGILVILGLFGKLGGAIASIPTPVAGGLFCILFGLIASTGLRTLAKADLTSMRNLLIIGFTIYMGLSVPAYFAEAELTISWAPWLAQIITTVGSTGMAVTAILGLILDNVIPGTPEEKGLVAGADTA
jgi:uracil-xanthine permease